MALRISVPMPARLTHRVLDSALNSSVGCGYWLCDYAARTQLAATNASPAFGDYVALHIGEHRGPSSDDDYTPVKHSRIGAARIAHALELMLTSGNVRHAERAGRVIAGAFDAQDADIVLQFAAFEEVVYG